MNDRQQRAAEWFEDLRNRICTAFERPEDDYAGPLKARPSGRFERSAWQRPTEDGSEGGGGGWPSCAAGLSRRSA